MTFYRRSMQRTLHYYGQEKHYLSKTPANSGRVGTLCETFLDARFIYTTRTPLSVIPSTMSLFAYQSSHFSDLLEPYPFGEYIFEATKHWYRYPLQRLAQNGNIFTVAKYDALVQDLAQTVRDIYTTLGLKISQTYTQVMKEEVKKARDYSRRHEYNLDDMGLTKEQIIAEYQDVFKRFGFDTEGA